jgi:putative Mn2+ efflux pump MntP
MLYEGITCKGEDDCGCASIGLSALLVQGVATSIDALSVGFTIAEYDWWMALVCCLVIAVVTFILCATGILLGKTFGTKLAGKASIFGGSILIIIGLKIFIEGVFLA